MKMGGGLFWGLLLLVLGVALIIKVVFNVDFPIFKILLGLAIIFIGLRVLFGRVLVPEGKIGPNDTIFSERVYDEPEDNREYSVVFGKGVYDFTKVDLSKGDFDSEVSTVFGGAVIKIKEDMPVKIEADAVFAGAEMPDGNTAVFGNTRYVTPSYNRDSASLNIKVNVVFGGVEVERW